MTAPGPTPLGSVSAAEPQLRDLMVLGLDGDRAAYSRLLNAVGGHLRAYFGRRLQNPGDVEDLVQETLLALHEKRETYRRDQPLTPWVFAIARYKLLNHLRVTHRRAAAPLDEAFDLGDPRNPEEGAVRHDLRRLLGFLPGRQRRMVEGAKLAGWSVAEVARREGLSDGAAKVSIHRALRALSARVRDED